MRLVGVCQRPSIEGTARNWIRIQTVARRLEARVSCNLVDVDLDVDLVDVDLDDQKYDFCLSRTDLHIVDGLNRNTCTVGYQLALGFSSWISAVGVPWELTF